MVAKANLIIDQGSTFSATIDVASPTDLPFDLTGYSIASQMRKNFTSSTANDFICSHNGVDGQITLYMDASITSMIEPGRYLYDVEMTSSGGTVTRVVEGMITVTPGITRI